MTNHEIELTARVKASADRPAHEYRLSIDDDGTVRMQTNHEIELTARVKASAGRPAQEYRLSIDADGTVRVWDRIAGHYTLCHDLSDRRLATI